MKISSSSDQTEAHSHLAKRVCKTEQQWYQSPLQHLTQATADIPFQGQSCMLWPVSSNVRIAACQVHDSSSHVWAVLITGKIDSSGLHNKLGIWSARQGLQHTLCGDCIEHHIMLYSARQLYSAQQVYSHDRQSPTSPSPSQSSSCAIFTIIFLHVIRQLARNMINYTRL